MSCEFTDFGIKYDNAFRVEIEKFYNDISSPEDFYRYKLVVLNILKAGHPSVSIKNDINIALPTADLSLSGIKIKYGKPVKLRILLDNEMKVYSYFYEWIKSINSMDNTLDLELKNTHENLLFCNLKLYVLKNNGLYDDKYFYYYMARPKSISSIEFATNNSEKKELYIDVEMEYNSFEFISK